MWRLLWCLIVLEAQADWAETINLAGMQRTLSQMMTKDFLMISRGRRVSEYKNKLLISMDSFNSTLHALMLGDSARGILPAQNQQVVTALQSVNTVWVTMEQLLRTNMDTVRRADGSLDMIVLEALSTQNVPLLDTSNEVVQAIVDAAQVSGATTNGLVQDIAGRQRTLIQRLAKGILFLAQGVAMSFNMQAYRNTKSLFETSHDGIIQGVPFAGLPVLEKVCTLHQMSEVSYYYALLRPLLTGITNADTPSKSQMAADEVAEEVVELVDPLYYAMVDAVRLFGNDDGSCNPAAGMTPTDWLSFFTTLSRQQLLTQQASQYFMQVALLIDVKTSQVEITVLMSDASMNLRNLIEGNKILGIPAPPAQSVVDALLSARETWNTLEAEMSQAVHLESISSVTVARVEQLSHYILEDLAQVMTMGKAMVANSSGVPACSIDLSSQQARLASSVSEYACLINAGNLLQENWDHLNASRATFEANRWKLLHGAPATETTPVLPKVTDVCIVKQIKAATDLFDELEVAALSVAHGNSEDLKAMVDLSPRAVKAFQAVTSSLTSGNSCDGNSSLSAEEWIQRHVQISKLASLSQEIPAEFTLVVQGKSPNRQRLDSLLLDLDTMLRRAMFGSFDPPVAAPQSQENFDHFLQHVEPTVEELKRLSSGSGVLDVVTAGKGLLEDALLLQEEYLMAALAASPSWPGNRVDLATRQVAVAKKVFKETILYAYDLRGERNVLDAAINEFQAAHRILKEGGSGIPAIMLPERQDLLSQWQRVDSAWNDFMSYQPVTTDDLSRLEASLQRLVEQLEVLVPLYHLVDVKNAERFPWPSVVYGIIGGCLAFCCCGITCRVISSRKSKADAQKTAMSVAVAEVPDEV